MSPTRARQAGLQLLTGAATLALLAALTVPAVRTLRTVAEIADPGPVRAPVASAHPRRVFGIYVDPWHAGDWARSVGAAPTARAQSPACQGST